jgi:hypothetical protein
LFPELYIIYCTLGRLNIMNFSSKLTLAIATAAVIYPIAANASPVVSTGSTAAAVSIKFRNCNCSSNSGNFSINPGANASGGGTGVQELSAAVATGETRANANSRSTGSGTTADARGYSAPVSLTYTTTSDVSNSGRWSEYTYNSDYKAQAAIEFAAKQKNSEYASASETEKIDLLKKGYYNRDGKYIKYSSSEMETASSGSSSDGSLTIKADGKASALDTGSGKNSNVTGSNERKTSYEYKGTSAGLSVIPAIPK